MGQFCNIIFLFLLKIGLVGAIDQQISLVSPNDKKSKYKYYKKQITPDNVNIHSNDLDESRLNSTIIAKIKI